MSFKSKDQNPNSGQCLAVFCTQLVIVFVSLYLLSPGRAASSQEHPLQPVNTSGPKATLHAFMTNAESAQSEFQQSGYRSKEAMKYIQRAASTLDLRQISTARRADVGFEATLRLKVILDNIEVPALDTIPGQEHFKDTDNPFWRIPNTDITIARITEGTRRGAWLFTAETVSQLPEYYKLIRESSGADQTTDWTFEKYIYSPGWMIPARLINTLPRWMRTGVFEQALWQWIGLILSVAIGAIILLWAYRAYRWLTKKMDSNTRRWRWERLTYPIFGVLVVIAMFYFIDEQVNITGVVLGVISVGLRGLILVFLSWAVLTCGDIFNEGISAIKHFESMSIAADVTRLVIRTISFIIVFLLFYSTAEHFGIPVNAIFASAGIAGLAVAFAAKDTLSNLLGGVTIFMDRPFRTGDYIVLDNNERGEVVQIGLRSTRIQTRDDIMITIPNSILTNTMIVNQSSPKPMFRVRIKIGVAYGSDINQVETVLLDQVRSNFLAVQYPEPRVRFRNFGDSSLEFELLCWARRPHDRGRLMHSLNTGIYNAFAEAGIEIPFPQRDVHLINEQKGQG